MIQNMDEQLAPHFADNDQEAERRFYRFRSKDPFPSIPAALLNSADISDYVAATGMVFPFEDTEKRLKSASYRIDLLGDCVYWDEKADKMSFTLEKNQPLVLKPNSIVFVTVEPMFRIPNYIALRFNLQISHVYKGLLVGTGPLVDPGFIGKLSLPLHNLTANTYTLKGGDPIIWMEFTKLSPNKEWISETEHSTRRGTFYHFPERKNELRGIDDYIEKAIGRDKQIISSIPYAIKEAHENAAKSADAAIKASETVRNIERQFNETVSDMRANNEKLSNSVTKDIEVIKIETGRDINVIRAETKAGIAEAKAGIEATEKRGTFWTTVASGIVILVTLGSAFSLILPSYSLVKTTTDNLTRAEQNLKNLEDGRVKELEDRIVELEKQVTVLENALKQSSSGASPSGSISKPPPKKRP